MHKMLWFGSLECDFGAQDVVVALRAGPVTFLADLISQPFPAARPALIQAGRAVLMVRRWLVTLAGCTTAAHHRRTGNEKPCAAAPEQAE